MPNAETTINVAETTVRAPHAATKTREGTTTEDGRTSVTIQEQGAALALFFDPERAFAGDAELLEIRLSPPETGPFEPWRVMPSMSVYLSYARAELAGKRGDVSAAISMLRQAATTTSRGLSPDFLRLVAQRHASLVADGEQYPVKALAASQDVHISTASRWISTARARGFIPKEI